MDHAVALVQAYLHVNGYLTVAEAPVLQALEGGGYKTATDIDLLALRLPHAGGATPIGTEPADPGFRPDPVLATQDARPDLLIVEVKEGRAEMNPGLRQAGVLEAVLTRWGFCPADRAAKVARRLAREGEARVPSGPRIRILAFGSIVDPKRVRGIGAISLAHVISYLYNYIREHWEIVRHAQVRQPVLGLLALLEQAGRQEAGEGD
jgi:hypothetical protein